MNIDGKLDMFLFHWSISVIFSWDILVTETFWSFQSFMKLAISVFLAYNFKHSNQNDSIIFDHIKNVSVYDRKKTGTGQIV